MKLKITLFSYGGVVGELLDCVFNEFLKCTNERGIQVAYGSLSEDALISRSRSRSLSSFLSQSQGDVCFMLDHDIVFESGDLLRTAEKAHRTGAIVGGVYSKRSPDAGIAQRIGSREGAANAPAGLLPAEYVSGGFLAILGVFGLNLLCCTLKRAPFKIHQIGYVTTHCGLMIILVGSMLSFRYGREGNLRLFRPEENPPVLLQAGDIVKFRPVTPEEWAKLSEAPP